MRNNSIREAFKQASSFLKEQGITDSLFETEWMLRKLIGVDRAQFFLMWDHQLTEQQLEIWEDWVNRRGKAEPLQYIFGSADFYGRSFTVTPAVLIPRPETELLLNHLLQEVDKTFGNDPIHAVEVGTGSGCIAISLKLERPALQVSTIDLSNEALLIAKQNAKWFGVEDQIRFYRGSFLEPVINETVEVIIANPPYIPTSVINQLDKEVKAYEPHLALDGGADGLIPYRVISQQIAALRPVSKRLVAFEIGEEQGEKVAELVKQIDRNSRVDIRQDMMNRDRYVIGLFEN